MTELVTIIPALPPVKVQLALAAWRDEHRARALTHGAYDAEIRRFRAALQQDDLDLESEPTQVP